MQRGDAAVVHGVRMRARIDEVDDHVTLGISPPIAHTGSPVCGVMEWFGTPSIPNTNLCTMRDE
jgi:hypothetical protein